MTEEEVAVTFDALGAEAVGEDACRALRSVLMSIENAAFLDRLLTLMTARPVPA